MLTIPAALTDAITAVTDLVTQFFALISGIVFPATLTPVSVLAAFAFIFPLIGLVLSFFRGLIRGS